MKATLCLLLFSLHAYAQDGVASQSRNGNPLSGYNCPSSCILPNCRCASANPPIANPPQFLLLTFDDAIQSETQTQALALFANRKNPNGCPARATFFGQTYYTDPYLVTQWVAAGNELGDHSMTHGGAIAGAVDNFTEYEGNRAFMSTFAGVNRGKIQGVRFPFLNYSVASLEMISKMGFLYDSSMAAGSQERFWPYTLDYGAATDCGGLWEIPMYTVDGTDGTIHLMDPYNDPSITAPISPSVVTASYQATFDKHYASKIPFGVYTHPIWLGKGIPPAIPSGTAKLAAVSAFLDYAAAKSDVWMVTHQQLIAYMKNPVSASQIGTQSYMTCAPSPAPPLTVCNGLLNSLAPETCNLVNGTIRTCYGCPTIYPDLTNPAPPRAAGKCSPPDTCDFLYWDSANCKCLCADASCAFNDTSRPIQSLQDFKAMPAFNNPNNPSTPRSQNSALRGMRFGERVLVALVFVPFFSL